MDWYEMIEEPIRETVRLLRDNGFNTISSCGHEMEIALQLFPDGEMKRLHDCLYNAGYRDYEISSVFLVQAGLPWLYHTTVKIKMAAPSTEVRG